MKTENVGIIVGFWTAVVVAIVVIFIALSFQNTLNETSDDLALLQADYDALTNDRNYIMHTLDKCRRSKDAYLSDLNAMPMCEGAVTRIEFLEGQLDSCTRAYAEERHDRKFYQKALEDVPAYCSLGLNQFVIDGLRDELDACNHQKGLLQHALADALNDRRIYKEELSICRREKVGAPCHQAHDGIRCAWDICERPEGWKDNFVECMKWTGLGFYIDGDIGYCEGASWFWDSENPGWTYHDYLYCKAESTCTTWSD